MFLAAQGLFLLTAGGRADRVADEYEVLLQAESLWERGTLAIDQCPDAVFFGKVGRGLDGKPHKFAPYGPLAAPLALPHHALARGVAAAAGVARADEPSWSVLVAAWTSLATSTWAALAVLGLFRACRALGASEGRAALAAALLGGTTFLWPYATDFYSEPVAAALLVGAVALHLEGRTHLAAAAALGFYLVKGTNGITAPALLALAAWPKPGLTPKAALVDGLRRGGPQLVAAVTGAVVHMEWNDWRFRNGPLDFGYAWTELLRPDEAARPFLLGELPRGLFGLLLSPGKSLLLFAPPVALGLLRLRALGRERPDVAACAGVALLVNLVVFGSYMYWEGGYCFGPRHLLPIVPLLLLPLAVGAAPPRRAVLACVVLGLPLQLLGVSVSFLEDQGLGPRKDRERYYAIDPTVPAGRPLNVYRLDYAPQLSYPRLLARHLRGTSPDGVPPAGVDLLPIHLSAWRRLGAGSIPPWAIALPFAAGLVMLGAAIGLATGRFHAGSRGSWDVSCDASRPGPTVTKGLEPNEPSAGELREDTPGVIMRPTKDGGP